MKTLKVSGPHHSSHLSAVLKPTKEIIPSTNDFNKQFLDLLQKIFVYDPKNRIGAKQALRHPWFKQSLVDDGSEAARIKRSRVEGRPEPQHYAWLLYDLMVAILCKRSEEVFHVRRPCHDEIWVQRKWRDAIDGWDIWRKDLFGINMAALGQPTHSRGRKRCIFFFTYFFWCRSGSFPLLSWDRRAEMKKKQMKSLEMVFLICG